MAITKLNSLAIPDNTIVEADLSYPLTNFSSTGIDDNATSTAITIDATEQVSTASHILAGGNLTVGTDGTVTGAEGAQIDLRGNDGTATQMYLDVAGSFNRMFTVSDNVNFQLGQLAGTGGDVQFFAGGSRKAKFDSDGLKFNNDTAAANALDDYEEGTSTTFVYGITATTNEVKMNYVKVGSLVHIIGEVNISGKSAGAANPYFTLPFSPSSTFAFTSTVGASIHYNTISSTINYFGLYTSNAAVYGNTTSGTYGNNYVWNTAWSDGRIGFSLTYTTF